MAEVQRFQCLLSAKHFNLSILFYQLFQAETFWNNQQPTKKKNPKQTQNHTNKQKTNPNQTKQQNTQQNTKTSSMIFL